MAVFELRPGSDLPVSVIGEIPCGFCELLMKVTIVPFLMNKVVGSKVLSDRIFTVAVPLAGAVLDVPTAGGVLAGALAQPAPNNRIIPVANINFVIFIFIST
jgi:hypothetical protein